MSRSRAASSIVGSPVLLGAITVLVIVVAVFLSYNANRGLPFVPTYNIRVEAPSAANLVEGNEVRIAGYRVGQVQAIRIHTKAGNRAIALFDMKLDKTVEPLPIDTQVVVRPRSVLGLKYVELKPGTSAKTLLPGATLPMTNSDAPVEFDDLLNTFDDQTRTDSQTSLSGFGDAFAGRGQSINIALQELPGLFAHLTPVMDTLNDPDTQLDEFFKQIGDAAAEARPVARTQAAMFTNLADTFEAISSSPSALQETISRQPPLYDAGIQKFPFQRAFLANFTDLNRRLRPAAAELRQSLPTIDTALHEGTKTNRITPIYARQLRGVFAAIDHLGSDPNTLLALKDLTTTSNVLKPLVEQIAPYNTVCNDTNYFLSGLADHASDTGNDGQAQRIIVKLGTNSQDDRFNDSKNDRPADFSKSKNFKTAKDSSGNDLQNLTAQANNPAIDARGNADCQVGQWGKLSGPLTTGGPYRPANFEEEETDPRYKPNAPSGGSHTVLNSNTPGLAGPTFTGVPSLQDVDKDLRR